MVLYLRGGPVGPRAQVYEERSLGRIVSTLGYHSLRLSRLPAAEFLARPEPLAWAFAALMRRAKGQSRPQLGFVCFQRIAGAPGLDHGERYLLCQCVAAYATRDDHEAREFDKILNQVENQEIQTMATNVLDLWHMRGLEEGREEGRVEGKEEGRVEGKEEGRVEGKEEGRVEGKEEGRVEGRREMLLHLLIGRFGSLPSVALRRVAAMTSVEELTRLATKVHQVESLEDLGLT